MSEEKEEKVYRRSDHGSVNEFMEHNFEKRECNRFRHKTTQDDVEICKCGYSKAVHSKEALQNEHDESKPLTKTFPTDAFGKLAIGSAKAQSSFGRYVRLDSQTDVNRISKCLFDTWKLDKPDVIFSVLSNVDIKLFSNFYEANTICESLVTAAATTNAWIITGGFNKNVDQDIGAAMTRTRQIPEVVLGFCHWGCLEEKKNLLTVQDAIVGYALDVKSKGMSLNQHHTHFLLVDDGKQKKSDCEWKLRQKVELSLRKNWDKNVCVEDTRKPLIYVLIGGGIREFGLVISALSNGIPVIIAKGTEGAADIISRAESGGFDMSILSELYSRLKELLTVKDVSAWEVDAKIAGIVTETKLELFFDIMELLDKVRLSEEDVQQFKNYDFADTLKIETTNDLLTGIKDLLVSKQTASNSSNNSTTKTEFVKRMRDVIGQMLVAKGIPLEDAKRAVNALEPNLFKKMLSKVRVVFEQLNAIRAYDKSDLLIIFDTSYEEKKTFTRVIVDVLKQANMAKACDVYAIAADWDEEAFFKELLLRNWMDNDHEDIFMKLANNGKTKYAQLMAEHFSNSNWSPKRQGQLQEALKKTQLCAKLLKKITNPESSTDSEDKRRRMKAKMLFIWCIQKEMSQSAMFLWEQRQDCLAMALVAFAECKRQMMELVNEEGFVKMKRHMEFFEELAIEFVRLCYADNPQNTHDLLVGKVEDLDDLTPLQIAVNANLQSFILIEPIQSLLTKVWIKDVEQYSKWGYVPMIVSQVCPLLAPTLFEIRLPSVDSKDEKPTSNTARCCKSVGNYLWKVITFVNTPLVKFSYSFIFHIAYLTLFSVVMLTDFWTKMSPSEITLTIWTFILTIEEVTQANVGRYWRDRWNYFDIPALTLYIIGFILRVIYLGDPTICPDCLYVARIVLTFSLMIFFFRTLQFLSFHDSLGPKIYMIEKLFSDLFDFMLILAVFVSSYGVGSNAILYPNQPLNAKLLKDVFYDAWWSVLQQFNREDALGLNCNVDNDSTIYTAEYCSNTSDVNIDYVRCKDNQCPANNWIVSVLLAFYALLTCIMLLNLLIAMFNVTFTKIDEDQTRVSKVQRFLLIREYSSHSMTPPPLCVITYPYYLILKLYSLCKNGNSESPAEVFVKNLDPKVKEWEQDMLETFYKQYDLDWLNYSGPHVNFHDMSTATRKDKGIENQKERESITKQRQAYISAPRCD